MQKTIETAHLIESLNQAILDNRTTLTQLASQVSSSPALLSNLLKGKVKSPNLSLVKRICDVLDLSYREVIYSTPLDFIKPGEEFNVILQRLMNEAAMSQSELSEITEFSKQYISQVFLSGKASVRFYDTVASLFGLSYNQITGKEEIDLEEVSKFFFPDDLKIYQYPILNDTQIGFIHDIDLSKLDEYKTKDSSESLDERGYFYKVKNCDNAFFHEGQLLGVKYPDNPEEFDHILVYNIKTHTVKIIDAKDITLYTEVVYRGTVIQM